MFVEIENESGAPPERASLRDLSSNGAMIQMATTQTQPEAVTIYFPADRISKTARVRWQNDLTIGVEFDEPMDLPERMRSRRNRAEVIASHFRHTGVPDQQSEQVHV